MSDLSNPELRQSRLFTASEILGYLILAAVIFVVLPSILDSFRLNLFGKYLSYAFVAIGLVLCWGVGGILSLGQGVFFGLHRPLRTPRSSRRRAFQTSWTGTS